MTLPKKKKQTHLKDHVWVKTRNKQMVPMPAKLEHIPAKLHRNMHLHLNDNQAAYKVQYNFLF